MLVFVVVFVVVLVWFEGFFDRSEAENLQENVPFLMCVPFTLNCNSLLHKVDYLQCRDVFGINSRVLYFTVSSVYRKCWLSDQLFTFF